jgi:ParB/RepB/Spo0J family partition protein
MNVHKTTASWESRFPRIREAFLNAEQVRILPHTACPMRKGQPRTTPITRESLSGLMNVIAKAGQLKPALVRPIKDEQFQYEILDGERRNKSIQLLRNTTTHKDMRFWAISVEVEDDDVPFVLAAIISINREPYTDMDICHTIVRLHDEEHFGVPEIARMLGMEKEATYRIYKLRSLVPEVAAMFDPHQHEKPMLRTTGIQISRLPENKQLAFAKRVQSGEIPSRAVTREVDRMLAELGKKPGAPSPFRAADSFPMSLSRVHERILDLGVLMARLGAGIMIRGDRWVDDAHKTVSNCIKVLQEIETKLRMEQSRRKRR